MSWDKSLLLGPVFALDTLRNRVNTTLKSNQNCNNTQEGDYLKITYLFISHDMAVIEEMSDNIAVMFMGRIVEYGDRKSVLDNPTHPYTQNLLRAVPVPDPNVKFKPPIFYDEDRFDPIVEVGSQNLEPLQYTQVSERHFVAKDERLNNSSLVQLNPTQHRSE